MSRQQQIIATARRNGFCWSPPSGDHTGQWSLVCTVCGLETRKGWPFNTNPESMIANMRRAGWRIDPKERVCPRCIGIETEKRRALHHKPLEATTALTTIASVESDTAIELPAKMPEVALTIPAVVERITTPEMTKDQMTSTRKKRVTATTGEKIAIRKLLAEHCKPVAGTPFFEYDEGWNDEKVAITAWRMCGSRPDAELNAGHTAGQRREPDVNIQLKPYLPAVAAQGNSDRLARVELFLEQIYGERWTNFKV